MALRDSAAERWIEPGTLDEAFAEGVPVWRGGPPPLAIAAVLAQAAG